jgi:hypothetical protein
MSSKRGQPARRRNTLPGQSPARIRGGIIAWVWRSTRQKLNRRLGSMGALTSRAAPYYYHESVGSLERSSPPPQSPRAFIAGIVTALTPFMDGWTCREGVTPNGRNCLTTNGTFIGNSLKIWSDPRTGVGWSADKDLRGVQEAEPA